MDNLTWTNTTPDSRLEGAQRVLQSFQLYYIPLLVALGIVGNCLSVFVFFRTKLRKLSSSYYLSALAISDTGFLVSVLVTWLNLIDVPVFNMPIVCQMSVYLSQACSFLSVWFVVAFTVERFIAVRYPLRRPSMCTVTRAKAVLAVLTLFALTLCSPYLLISAPQTRPHPDSKNTTVEVCTVVEKWMDVAEALNYVDFIVTLLLPFSLIVVLNTLISKTVWRLARIRRSMTLTTTKKNNSGSFFGEVRRPTLARAQSRTSSSQTKVTEMLLIVSTVFICLNLPSYVIRFWVFVNEAMHTQLTTVEDIIILQHYFNLLFTTNFGINFALYCVSGQNFRRALITLFCPRYRRRHDNTQITVVSEYSRSPGSLCRRRTVTINGSWREVHEMIPINK